MLASLLSIVAHAEGLPGSLSRSESRRPARSVGGRGWRGFRAIGYYLTFGLSTLGRMMGTVATKTFPASSFVPSREFRSECERPQAVMRSAKEEV